MPPAVPDAQRPAVVVVSGPTAAGKTALGIRLAERFDAEILNADSMQVYRYMDVGTAKPSADERARVPHHLIDIVTPDVPYNAGRYVRDARAAEARVRARGRRVMLVGGTGLYVRAFLEGLASEVPADPDLRRSLEEEHERAQRAGDPERLHRRLAHVDPETAARLHPHDRVRIVRALEVFETTGERPSDQRRARREAPPAYRSLQLVVDPGREPLARRIDARCEQMIERGLLQEVRALRERGRHMQPVIDGRETLAQVLELMKRDTRQFARRQRTWWRAVKEACWVHPEEGAAIEARVTRFLEEAEASAVS